MQALSEQQRIGLALQSSLREGKEVADELYIAAILDAITSAKGDTETNGWIRTRLPPKSRKPRRRSSRSRRPSTRKRRRWRADSTIGAKVI